MQIYCPQRFLKNSRFFFEKQIFFFQKGANFSTFWEIVLNQLQPNTNFSSLAVFKKITIFFRETHIFHLIKTNFERFEKSYFFSRILRQNCFFWRFWKKSKNRLEKPIYFSFKRKPIFESFEKSYLFIRILVLVCYL